MNRIGWLVLLCALVLLHTLLVTGCGGSSDPSAGNPLATDTDGGSGGALGAACTPGLANSCQSGLQCPDGIYDATGPRCTYTCDAANPNPLCTDGCNPKGYCRLPQ